MLAPALVAAATSKFTNLLQPIPRPWPWLMFYISSLSRHRAKQQPRSRVQARIIGGQGAEGAGTGGESSCACIASVAGARFSPGRGKLQASATRERRVKYFCIAHIGHTGLGPGTRYDMTCKELLQCLIF